jgi:hypothetical protein
MGDGIKEKAYWSTYGTLAATATTTLISPNASSRVYLCYGFLDVRGSTTTKKIKVIVASTTTNTLWTVDCTANNVGNHGLIFGEKGFRVTLGAALYLINDATQDAGYAFSGYTADG